MGQRRPTSEDDTALMPVVRESGGRGVRGESERHRVLSALEQARGNQTKAAALLGVSRRTLINRLESFGLPRPRKRVHPNGGE
jgi:two-component system response regulator AtoC